MICFKNEEEVIEAYKEIGRPLEPEIISDLDQVDAELRDMGTSREMIVVNLQCRICNHKQVAIAPIIVVGNMECANCGNMTAQEKEVEK